MSQPDLLTELRRARPVAPPELREHVRQLAAAAAAPSRRRFTWRRSLVVVVPVAAVIVGAAILLPGNGTRGTSAPLVGPDSPMGAMPASTPASTHRAVTKAVTADATGAGAGANPFGFATSQATGSPRLLPGQSARVQRISTTLNLRLRTSAGVSNAAQRANAITRSLHGYVQSAYVNAAGKNGDAELVLRIPRSHVNEAVSRLSALGAITAENFGVQDLTAQVNATTRHIATLQRKLATLRAETATPQITREIAGLTTQIQRLQRGTAATIRQAHYATVDLRLATPPQKQPVAPKPHNPGPLHGLGVAFHWIWIGAVYVLALGLPLFALLAAIWFAVRAVRHRREEQLLNQA